MGNFAIIIRGVGPHQNDKSYDAERVAKRCVSELLSYGHTVRTASVETGGTSLEIVGEYPAIQLLNPPKDPDEPACAAYERYLHSSGGKSLVSGADLPDFSALPENIKDAWRAAVDPSAPRLVRK